MDYLVMIENAMNMHNLSLLLMPESYQGGEGHLQTAINNTIF